MFAVDGSVRCSVREHSSTATRSATSRGRPRSRSSARARPAAPPAQPHPNDGVRRTSGRRPSRVATSTSSVGAPTPVTVVRTTWSTSSGRRPASSSAARHACSARSVPSARKASLAEPNDSPP
ncbi:Uncharacterised protein [Mycobacteroides abscessus]|nr:Uncharacterised protein [Mycobacteroides abscessus]